MTLKAALDALVNAFADLEIAVRSDDKTSLQNSLALDEAKERFATTPDTSNVVVFADINELKFINGQYGQSGGDAAINQIGIKIRELFVDTLEAKAFRVGGDEFVILLNEKFIESFCEAAASFTECSVPTDVGNFSVGLSFGYALKDGEADFETIRERAETACKHSKKQGSAITLWTEEIAKTAIESLRKNCTDCGAVTTCYVAQEMNLTSIRFCAVCGKSL